MLIHRQTHKIVTLESGKKYPDHIRAELNEYKTPLPYKGNKFFSIEERARMK